MVSTGLSRCPIPRIGAAVVSFLLCVPVAAQVRFEIRNDQGVAGAPIQAGLNQTFTATVYIVNTGSTTIAAFQVAVTHDPTYMKMTTIASPAGPNVTWKGTALDTQDLRAGKGPEYWQATEIKTSPVGFTLGAMFEVNPPYKFTLGTGEFPVAIITYQALQLTPDGSPARLAFADSLGTPPITNCYGDNPTGACNAPSALVGADVTVGQEVTYTIAFSQPAVQADTGTQVTIPVYVTNTRDAVDGFSFGVKHDGSKLDLVDVTLGDGITSVLGGQPDPRFYSLNKTPANGPGFTMALVLSSDLSKVLDPATSPHLVANAVYKLKLASGDTTPVAIAGTLGQPAVGVVLDINGYSQPPLPPSQNPPPVSVTITATGVTPTNKPFIRGDVNQSGAVNITDAIGVLTYIFDAANLPPQLKATADTCLMAYNIDGSTTGGVESERNIDINDPVYLLNYLFMDGNPPAAPFLAFGKQCGDFAGQTNDRMKCTAFTCPP